MLINYLRKNYKDGEPIFLSDINVKGMTQENIRYHLKKYTDEGLLSRFEPGIYYFPKDNQFGEKSVISAETVVYNKYICRKNVYVGYYSGHTFMNRIGLSTQVPFIEEITSNYAPALVRKITIKNRSYLIRKPVVKINENNMYTLQILDCLKSIGAFDEEDIKSYGEVLSKHISEHKISKDDIDKYISNYPTKVYKAIYETGVNYVSSQ